MPATPARRLTPAQFHAMIRGSMHERFQLMRAKTGTRTPEEFYGFRAEDVAELYTAKIGFGSGTWWGLLDGRVFDSTGCPSQPERHWYEAPLYSIHGPGAEMSPARGPKTRAQLYDLIRQTMRDRFIQVKGLTPAATPEEFYGFRAEDVVEVYRHKMGALPGVWWRLKDGRVFDAAGRSSQPERHWYEYTEH